MLGCIVIVLIYSFVRSFFPTVFVILNDVTQEESYSVYLRRLGYILFSSLCLFNEISSMNRYVFFFGCTYSYSSLHPKLEPVSTVLHPIIVPGI